MTITEALEKGNGKARRDFWHKAAYAFFGEDNYLWIHYAISTKDQNLTKEDMLATDWLPYSPEPEKCEACKEADDRKTRMTYPDDVISDHLRKYHCQCKKEAP